MGGKEGSEVGGMEDGRDEINKMPGHSIYVAGLQREEGGGRRSDLQLVTIALF